MRERERNRITETPYFVRCSLVARLKRRRTEMATGLKALPFSFGAHFLALIAAIMVLVWCIHFRGGLAWEAENKNLIFNVSKPPSLFMFMFISDMIIIYRIVFS